MAEETDSYEAAIEERIIWYMKHYSKKELAWALAQNDITEYED